MDDFRQPRRVLRLMVIAGLLASVGGSAPPVLAREAAVIVNAQINLADIELGRLRRIYEGKQKKLEGADRVFVLVVPPEKTGEREAVLKTVYQLDEQRFFQFWQGETLARKPRELAPEAALDAVGRDAKAMAIVGTRCPESGDPAMPEERLEIGGDEPCEARVTLLEVGGHAVALAGAACQAGDGATGGRILEAEDLRRLAGSMSGPGLKAGVKVLRIDGLEPCKKDYPLRSRSETRK